ncbi:putative phage abortive infection protein [Alteromonas sp. A079]|uniref:putative phage abortive infection protein n=1 Tax=Alteromonas sp. A079 TaxID=3410268 RepID=UPI003BA34567
MKLLHFLKSEKLIASLIVFGLLLLFSSFPMFLWNDLNFDVGERINSEKFGHLGDFVGGLMGSLWALAGVFLFYKALTEQRDDFSNNREALRLQVEALEQQIEEFKLSREEQRLSRRVYEEQSKTAKIQQFDSSFYSLLNVYLNIKNHLNSISPDFFKEIVGEISAKHDTSIENPIEQRKNLISSFNQIYDDKREVLSSYFRALYRLLSIIDSATNLTDKEKFNYAKVLRAQLSDYELIVLSYNSYTFLGKKTQYFILKYNLLKHIPVLSLPSICDYQRLSEKRTLAVFVETLSKFLRKNIPKFYDVNNDDVKIEEEFSDLNLILGIYFDDEINIKVYTEKNIENCEIYLTDEQFNNFLLQLAYELLVLQTYLLEKDIFIEKSKTEFDDKKAFCLSIKTKELIILNEDDF